MYWRCPVRVTVSDEVHGQDRVGLGPDEGRPRDGCPVRGRVDALGLEDLPYGGGSDRDAQEGEFTVDAPIAPGEVLGCQAQDEAADRGDRARTPRPTTPARLGMAAFHQVPMPPQHRVWADQQLEPAQRRAGQGREQGREQRPVLGPQARPLIAELSL